MLRRFTVIVPLSVAHGTLTHAQSTLDFEQFDYEIGSFQHQVGDYLSTAMFVDARDFHEAGVIMDKLKDISPCVNYFMDGSGTLFKYDRVTKNLTRCFVTCQGTQSAIKFRVQHSEFYFVEGS
ncbi:hypothetical protein HOU66_gp09 [Pectobacterium phage Arno160]|uniref:Uncharacterized protein n=1 Tax=Pectobacterium phage Arno160 TaxID=2488835 RepID=A0A3G8F1S8_9CAUD|nr:hypothetical protein HOU66_gp09 [Pectobacterium phage Arno160]AZF88071.1 hypothetical protein Arno160_gp09 [Pectobacterium phage Arno160]